MRATIVLTLTGRDRIGIVADVTRVLVDLGGNVETSRMARLGGEFAMLMLVSLPEAALATLDQSLAPLTSQGYKISTLRTEQSYAQSHPGWLPFHIEVHGADHEGIVQEVAHSLSHHGINIESMETGTASAPVSGAPLFSMTALVAVPPKAAGAGWQAELIEVGRRANVEIHVTAAPTT